MLTILMLSAMFAFFAKFKKVALLLFFLFLYEFFIGIKALASLISPTTVVTSVFVILMFVFIISGFFTKKMSVHYEKEIKKRPVR